MHAYEFRRTFYCLSYKARNLLWLLFWVLFIFIALHYEFSFPIDWIIWSGLWILLEIISLIFPAWISLPFSYLGGWITQGLVIILKWLHYGFSLPIALILLAIILLIFPAWFSLYFRYLACWISQGLGVIIRWLRSGWTIALLLVLGVASTLFIRETIIDSQKNITMNSTSYSFLINNATWTEPISVNWIEVLSPDFWLKVFAIIALLFLAYQAYNSRKRIVLLLFSNQTGDEELKSSIEGISSLLQNELARLTRLCIEVDDTNPYSPGTFVIDEKTSSAKISVSVEDNLENIVTSDTKVKLGPLEIPVGASIGLLAKVTKGPQLTGSLHKEDGRLVLIANLKGGRFNNDWRITSPDIPDQEPSPVNCIAHMTQQLAYRIFTDLNRDGLGSTSWKAVCHYTEGLRAYKETLRTERDKSPKLRRAEKAFLLALGEDTKFLKCYYNLGVVYNELDQKESAFSVLKKSIDPDQPEEYLSQVYYALAGTHYKIQDRSKATDCKADYKISIKLCEKAIELQPEQARNWDLLGYLKRREKEYEPVKKLTARDEFDFWNEEVIPIRETATALAWREMCCYALKSKNIKGIKKIAVTCTRNLAVAHSQANPASGKPYFDQAIYLAPSDAELYYELGKTLNNKSDWSGAAKVLEDAVMIEQRPAFWSELAIAYANLYENANSYEKDVKEDYEKRSLYACGHVMDCPSVSEKERDILMQTEEAISKLLDKRNEECNEQYRRRLEELTKRLSIRDWGHTQAQLKLNKAKDVDNYPRIETASELLESLNKKNDESKEKYRNRLEKLKERQLDPSWDWAHSQVSLKLSSNYIEPDREKAGNMLENALTNFEKNSSSEIIDKKVHVELAKALMSQKEYGKALYHAQRSVALSPEGSWDRYILSQVHQSYGDFEESNSQLDMCLSIDPKKYDFNEEMAWSKFKSIIKLRDMEMRRNELMKYIGILQRFLELVQSDFIKDQTEVQENITKRSRAYFWLGYANYELNKYDLAISNWNESKYISEKSAGRSHLIAMLWLGTVHLDIKAYYDCEYFLKDLIKFIEIIEKEHKVVKIPSRERKKVNKTSERKFERELVGDEFGFYDVSLGYLMAHACLSLSFSFAQRHANLIDANNLVEKAEGYIKNVLDPDRKNELDAMHDDRKGWIIYTQVKLGEGSNNIKDAIDWLKKAVNKNASPENYLHLAMALEYKIDTEGGALQKTESRKSELQRLLDYALACCDHVIDLDLQKKYAEQTKELRKRLEKLRKNGRQ